MIGTCQKCGCTEEHACQGGCVWIDAQEDLCSRCARELLTAPLDNLSDALLAVRTLRAAVIWLLAAEDREIDFPAVASQIWTPE